MLGHYSQTGELVFTNAGHLPPLWYHAHEKEWSFMLESTPYSKNIADLPIGLIAGTGYSQTAVQLAPDDLVILYTDGISETTNGAGEELQRDGLLTLAQSVPVSSALEAGEALLARVEAFRGPGAAGDDETFIVLHRAPATLDGAWPR